jgi:tetratricopeptide (TPR) repeat protein
VALWRKLGDTRGLARALSALAGAVYANNDLLRARSLVEESIALFRGISDKAGLARTLRFYGAVLYHQCDYERAKVSAEESIALAQEIGDIYSIADATASILGRIAFEQGDLPTARLFFEKSLKLFRDITHTQSIRFVLSLLGDLLYAQQDYEQAGTYCREGLELAKHSGKKTDVAWLLITLGHISLQQNHREEARAYFTESLLLHRELMDRWGIVACLTGFARIAEQQAQRERAARLLGATETIMETQDTHLAPFFDFVRRPFRLVPIHPQTTSDTPPEPTVGQIEYGRIASAVRSVLGEEVFEDAVAKGREMSLDEAIAYALEGQPEEMASGI